MAREEIEEDRGGYSEKDISQRWLERVTEIE